MFNLLNQWWKMIKTVVLISGVLLSFFIFVEILHVYVILKDTYAPLGYGFLVVLSAFLVYLILYVIFTIRKQPRVIIPPVITDFDQASIKECEDYARYLINYSKRLIKNPSLTFREEESFPSSIDEFEADLKRGREQDELIILIRKYEKELIEPLLSRLGEVAEREVRNGVRDIMMGVTLSPYRAIDLLIVIYRNISMVLRIMTVYHSRPRMTEQLLILRDVLRVVATVNYMNFGQKLMEQFLSKVPYVGRALDDVAQGIGAGLLSSAAGHGAIYRCRAYRGWNQEIAVQTMSSHVKDLLVDVKNIFRKDILPGMRERIFSSSGSEERKDPGFWEKTTDGMLTALDMADTVMNNLIVKPVMMGGLGTIRAGSATLSLGRDIFVQGSRGMLKGAKIMALGAGSGIRYTGSKAWSVSKMTAGMMKGIIGKKKDTENQK